MTLCPIAIVASRVEYPGFKVCPMKGVIGDYKKPLEAKMKQRARIGEGGAKRKPRSERENL